MIRLRVAWPSLMARPDATGQAPQVAIARAFTSAHPAISLEDGTTAAHDVAFGLLSDSVSATAWMDLSESLRMADVDLTALDANLIAACTTADGRLLALPYEVVPEALSLYALGLTEDHEAAAEQRCWSIAALVAVATAIGRDAPIPALPALKLPPPNSGPDDPLVWSGFVRGYGGQLWDGEGIVLTDAGALEGLAALSHLASVTGWDTTPMPRVTRPMSIAQTAFQFVHWSHEVAVLPRVGSRARMAR